MPEQLSLYDQQRARLDERLRRELGPTVLGALANPSTIEVMCNADGRLWVDETKSGLRDTGALMSAAQVERLIGTVAAMLGTVATRERPVVDGELPLEDCRFCGVLPPVARSPVFCIRKPAVEIFTFEDYVRDGILDAEPPATIAELERHPVRGHVLALHYALRTRKNILVVGGVKTGKTTLARTILRELELAVGGAERVVVIEDTRELRCTLPNHVELRVTEDIDMTRLVRTALRLRPDRIVVGEVRGPEGLALMKAWNTGHPGGIGTVHANDARAGLLRVESLVQEANVPVQPALIAEAVDLIVVLVSTRRGLIATEVAWVTGLSATGYVLEKVTPVPRDASAPLGRNLVAV